MLALLWSRAGTLTLTRPASLPPGVRERSQACCHGLPGAGPGVQGPHHQRPPGDQHARGELREGLAYSSGGWNLASSSMHDLWHTAASCLQLLAAFGNSAIRLQWAHSKCGCSACGWPAADNMLHVCQPVGHASRNKRCIMRGLHDARAVGGRGALQYYWATMLPPAWRLYCQRECCRMQLNSSEADHSCPHPTCRCPTRSTQEFVHWLSRLRPSEIIPSVGNDRGPNSSWTRCY
jgi:hypothetical protein